MTHSWYSRLRPPASWTPPTLSPRCTSQQRSHIQPLCATSRALSFINLLCYLHFQLFDPEQRIDSKYEGNSPSMPAQWLLWKSRVNQWLLPTRREHSSHLSARISGLVTSRANLLQRSVTLNPPVVLSACPWMSAGIGSLLGPLISLTMVENMSMNGSGISSTGRQLRELLPFTVFMPFYFGMDKIYLK